jgi:2-oxoglutarate dehydrogenase E2 component (dihydrolipoamide succinyltransferase)
MPQLGETVTEGTITRWAKSVGDAIAEDEVLFEVSTDKVDSEVPSPVAGVVSEILVPEGETVDVGTRLAVISDGAAGPPSRSPTRSQSQSRRRRRRPPSRRRRRLRRFGPPPPNPTNPLLRKKAPRGWCSHLWSVA